MSDSETRLTAVLGPTNTGKTHFAMERLIGHRSGMIGFPAAAPGARKLRPSREGEGPGAGRAGHRRGKDHPARRALFRLHGRIHAGRPAGRVRRDRRDPARRRFRARPHLHRPAAACARPGRDHGDGLRLHQPLDPRAGAEGRVHPAPALLHAHLRRAEEDHPPATRAAPSSPSPPPKSMPSPI